MSLVTNIILTFSVMEEEREIVPAIDAWLKSKGEQSSGFGTVLKAVGGPKALEANVCVGAFNYLDLRNFVDALHDIKWLEPENVRCFAQEQEDDVFSEVFVRRW